jgi:hypothetical protein
LRVALGGDTRLVLVVGDAGVGKTRLAGEGMRRAAAQGMVTLWGSCLPLAKKLPLLPITEALGELSRLESGGLLEAMLGMVPPYVRAEVERLLPQLGPGGPATGGSGEGWRRERLFAGVADLLGTVAQRCGLGLVIEDVQWADTATLDFLTYLARAGGGPLTVVVTCRSDEPRLDAQVAGWLAQVRGSWAVEEIRLRPLSREEVADEIAALVGGPPPARLVDEVYARAEGNPFFTEQLVAAAQEEAAGGVPRAPAGLPARLAELLAARAGRCRADARVVLRALAVAGRPLTEDLLAGITRSDVDAVRRALRELGAARLLADSTPEGAYRLRHALLAEAVAAGLLSGERVTLHKRTAQALQAAGHQMLAAEAAGHWAAAGRAAEELPARVAAAEAAERVFGYAEAAAHWQRAIELYQQLPGAGQAAGAGPPPLYLRAIDALDVAGDGQRAGALAEEAYRRFAGHPDPATAAVVHLRAAYYRGLAAPDAGLPLIKEALRLFEQLPPSAEHAEAWFHYGGIFLFHAEGRLEDSRGALNRALEIADGAGATALMPRILAYLAVQAFTRGQIGEGVHHPGPRAGADRGHRRGGRRLAGCDPKRHSAEDGEIPGRRRGGAAGPAGRPPGRPPYQFHCQRAARQRVRGAAGLGADGRGGGADRPADRRAARPGPLPGAHQPRGDRPAARRHRGGRAAVAADQRGHRPLLQHRLRPRSRAAGRRTRAVGWAA